MKTWLVGALIVAVAAIAVPSMSEAKRLGSGKSSGMQRDMPARTAPDAPPAKPAAPTQAAAPVPGVAAAAGTAAAAGKRSWMGPIAGLAAFLGLAALMSHLGMGEGFANILMIALLAAAAFFVIRLLMRRFGGGHARAAGMQYAGPGAATPGASNPGQVAWPAASTALPEPSAAEPLSATPGSGISATNVTGATTPARTVPQAFVPASFDGEAFGRAAKMIFIRLQAANDARDLDDLRSFTTPEMFAAVKIDLQDRGDAVQQTDVVRVDADVLDVAQEDGRQVVSVRFHGLMKEELGSAEPTRFDEVWHLVKPLDDSRTWAIAGIEQTV